MRVFRVNYEMSPFVARLINNVSKEERKLLSKSHIDGTERIHFEGKTYKIVTSLQDCIIGLDTPSI